MVNQNSQFLGNKYRVAGVTSQPVFDTETYLKNKADEFNRKLAGGDQATIDIAKRFGMGATADPEEIMAAFVGHGLTPQQHYEQYGRAEGVSPYAEPAPPPIEAPTTVINTTPPPRYTPTEEETVEGRMEGLLADDSKYIQAARGRSQQQAHSRGLLNTSIAAGAGERAAIEAAFPIASQDADAFTRAGLQRQAYDENVALTGLQTQYASMLSAQEAAQNLRHATTLEQTVQAGANYRQSMEQSHNRQLAQMDMSIQEKDSFARQMTTLGDNFQAKVAGIQVDPNLTPEAKADAIESVRSVYESNLRNLGQIYGVNITWDF